MEFPGVQVQRIGVGFKARVSRGLGSSEKRLNNYLDRVE